MNWHEHFESEIKALKDRELYRAYSPRSNQCGRIFRVDQNELINFSSNDYLGLAHNPEIIDGAHQTALIWGNGSGGSRHLGGDTELAHQVEDKIAQLRKAQSALLFNSGYQANVALGSAFQRSGLCVFADELCHASLWDGIRMGGVRFSRFRHNDLDHLQTQLGKHSGPKIIMSESVFSMDGDLAPLPGLLELSRQYEALLIIDEAHADGIMGLDGHGLVPELQCTENDSVLSLSTFGKAYGVFGAAVSGPKLFRDWLVQKGRSLIYSTGLSPLNLGAINSALDIALSQPWRRQHVQALAHNFRQQAEHHGFHTYHSQSQIIPIHIGNSAAAVQYTLELKRQGFLVHPVRPPTIPEGQARLRINICAFHQSQDCSLLMDALRNLQQ